MSSCANRVRSTAWLAVALAISMMTTRLPAQMTDRPRSATDTAGPVRGTDPVTAPVADSALDSARRAPLSPHRKVVLYVNRTFSVRALLGASYAAGIAQWRGTPREWGAGLRGYGRRDAAAYGGGVIRHTAEFGFGELLHEDPRFERSSRNGLVPRTEDALRTAFIAQTDDGGHRVAWSRALAAIATGFAVNSWEPRRMHSTHHALMLSLAGALSYPTASVTQEFTPDIRRYILRKLHIGKN
jgi:hypothetical protein